TGSIGTGGTGSIGTGGTGGGVPDNNIDYGGYPGGGGGGTPPHVASAPLPASAGAWSSGGWALGGMLHGAETQWAAWGPWREDTLCLTVSAAASPANCSGGVTSSVQH